MEEAIKTHLEGVYNEYIEYRDFYKTIYKTPEERRRLITESIDAETNEEEILDLVFQYNFQYNRYESDIYNLLTRLYHTVIAYKDIIEIPDVLLKEVENFKMIQSNTFKNGEKIELNKEENEQIKIALKQNWERVVKEFTKQPTQ